MDQVLEALRTGAGMLWKALWALIFGYIVSAAIQVFVTREQMGRALGERGAKKAGLAGFFGFVSSSCSFAALAASRSVLTKGAHPANALAFLIASTNLVIELGIVLLVLLSWHFLVGNLLLGVLMIVYAYLLTRVWFPGRLADQAREHAERQQQDEEGDGMDPAERLAGRSWREKLRSREGWQAIADAFVMEWKMVYKEILLGFTIAGFISVFVPQSFWSALFLLGDGAGAAGGGAAGGAAASPPVWTVVENALVAPIIAFFTFIGSMGNVPLAAMLWSRGASFGGVMSFLGADLVAATVIWVHHKYYGWRYTLYLSALLYVSMVAAGLTVHLLAAVTGMIPEARPRLEEMVRFEVDYTFWLNLVFLALGLALSWLHWRNRRRGEAGSPHGHADAAPRHSGG